MGEITICGSSPLCIGHFIFLCCSFSKNSEAEVFFAHFKEETEAQRGKLAKITQQDIDRTRTATLVHLVVGPLLLLLPQTAPSGLETPK